jgi:hypothetical protein
MNLRSFVSVRQSIRGDKNDKRGHPTLHGLRSRSKSLPANKKVLGVWEMWKRLDNRSAVAGPKGRAPRGRQGERDAVSDLMKGATH